MVSYLAGLSPALLYQHLRRLSICYGRIQDEFFSEFSQKFPHLEDLSLLCLESIKISSVSLKRINLADNVGLQEAQFHVPSIVLFQYAGGIETRVSFVSASERWMSRVKVRCNKKAGTLWFMKLKDFLTRLSQCSQVFVTAGLGYNVDFNLDEVTKSPEIAEFCVNICPNHENSFKYPKPSALALLGGIFWACRPCAIKTSWHVSGFTKILYEFLVLRSEPNYFGSPQVHFWNKSFELAKDIEICDSKMNRIMQLPRTLDWKAFLKALEAQDLVNVTVCFNLQWQQAKFS
ncbi:OLC1v1005016C1 [Oldenlandia corymbosa var. corymbosa]|uniref:OLC1v1005016C1 n=1 Tax=Oldenlandia corymbosa var. corymbosa TaxID=529605 RepID=A0AAV1DH40_OLDCO|nr:OLC1v1005016C1 [Oldenlandia corymbosa var. corymbosa]